MSPLLDAELLSLECAAAALTGDAPRRPTTPQGKLPATQAAADARGQENSNSPCLCPAALLCRRDRASSGRHRAQAYLAFVISSKEPNEMACRPSTKAGPGRQVLPLGRT